MARFMDDRAPLECTKSSTKTMAVGCPKCKTARVVSVDWYGSICSHCNIYFNKEIAIKDDECDSVLNTKRPINTKFTKIKAEMEKKAYAYKENVMDKRKNGTLRSHEPGNFGYRK